MRLSSFRSRFFVFGTLMLVVSFFSFLLAVAEEEVSLPIPIPLLGDYGQAALYFEGSLGSVSPDISAMWRGDEGELSFVIHGDITALYRWKYDQGEVSLLNVKDQQEDADSFLLEGAQEQNIGAFFSQDQHVFGIDGMNGHLFKADADGWHIGASLDWISVAQSLGLERINFEDASKKPYDFVKTDSFLYCLIPRTSTSPLLISINLETQAFSALDISGMDHIQAFQANDLLIKTGSALKRFDAANQTLTEVFPVSGAFVYDSEQNVLFYELNGALYESEDLVTSRAICTPAMSKIHMLGALPQHKLAVYGDKGISIVNTQLNPDRKLRIQDYYTLSNESELFSLANPDVTVEMVNASFSDADFMPNDKNLDIITQASIADIPGYCRKDYLAPLSGSARLRSIVQTYYPQIREVVTYHDALFAIPLALGVSCYQADGTAFEAAGSPNFPKDMDTFFQQVEQFATKDVYDDSQIHLENILYDLTEQYCTQYATESAPMRFDSPVYRSILSRMKGLATKGITGSCLYFSADSPGYHLPYELEELGSDGMIPFAFPFFEPNQTPKLSVNLEIYLINKMSKNQEEAIRFLEFVSMYPDNNLKYSLSPQHDERPLDIADKQKQVINLSLSRLHREAVDMDGSERLERINALMKKSQMLDCQEREITDSGLSFYRANARNMSFQSLGCYDFVVAYDREPYFCSFLYGSMSADDLIMMLNARAYDNYTFTQ